MIRRLIGAFVTAVVIVAVAAGTLAYRKVYGTWWQTPEHITYCGRTYETDFSAVLSRADIVNLKESLPGDAPYPVLRVGRVPPIVGQPLLAAVTPESVRNIPGRDSPLPCAMGVYLKIGPDAYNAYLISGGP
jgi:hypothetical protein